MANITDVTNILPTSHEGYVDNLSASISSEASTVPVNSASAYLDGDVAVLTVDPGTPEEATFTGTKASSPDRFVNCKWTEGNIGAGHASGSAVVDYVSATHYNLLSKALKGILNQDGSYKSSVLESILQVQQRTTDLHSDFVFKAPTTDITGLSRTYGEVTAYIGGDRVTVPSGEVLVLTGTSDNWIYVDTAKNITNIAVAVGAPEPTLPANSLWLGKYTTDASSITVTDESMRLLGGKSLSNTRYYNTNGTHVWRKPANMSDNSYIIVELQAGGGGGGGTGTTTSTTAATGGGGGGGEYARKKILAADLGATETIIVGGGGNRGSQGSNPGSDGGDSSFGSHFTAKGGSGGSGGGTISANNFGAGGGSGGKEGAGTADLRIPGGTGETSILFTGSTSNAIGGASYFAFPAETSRTTSGVSPSSTDNIGRYGVGAAGGANSASQSTARFGGFGGSGIVIVHEYI